MLYETVSLAAAGLFWPNLSRVVAIRVAQIVEHKCVIKQILMLKKRRSRSTSQSTTEPVMSALLWECAITL